MLSGLFIALFWEWGFASALAQIFQLQPEQAEKIDVELQETTADAATEKYREVHRSTEQRKDA